MKNRTIKHQSLPKLVTERLLLRSLLPRDWEVISYLRTDKEVNQFVKRSSAPSKEQALAFITKINQGIDKQTIYYWSIVEKNTPTMIGSLCLWNFSEARNIAEVGYDLHPDFQGRGIMNEALQRVLAFGFNNLQLKTIEAFTHYNNDSSKRLLERNNFKLVKKRRDDNNKDNIIYELRSTLDPV